MIHSRGVTQHSGGTQLPGLGAPGETSTEGWVGNLNSAPLTD